MISNTFPPSASGGGLTGAEVPAYEINYVEVNTYADLPLASSKPNDTYIVRTATGTWLLGTLKKAGLYYSNGVAWSYMGNSISIDDASTSNESVWSSGKTSTMLGGKSDTSHIHTGVYEPVDATIVRETSADTLENKIIDSITNTVGSDHVHYKVRNASGSTIAIGTVITAMGTQPGTDYIQVMPVTDPTTQVAIGLAHTTLLNNGVGLCISRGVRDNVNTDAWAVGTILYPNTAGGFTTVKPASGMYQACAYVMRQHISSGTLLVNFIEPKTIASTTVAGEVRLNDTLSSTSTVQALTAAQGKVLQDSKASTAVATTVLDGLMSSTDKTKLDGVSGTNTGDETTSTIKTKLGVTTLSGSNTGDQDLSGYSLTTHNHTVDGLSNVVITANSDNELLTWDAATSKWINQTATEAGLATDTHVHTGVYEPADATILKDADIGSTVQAYNVNTTTAGNTFNGISQLVQTTAAGKLPAIDGSLLTNLPSGATTLDGLTDVIITTPAADQLMIYNGTNWVNATNPGGSDATKLPLAGGDMTGTIRYVYSAMAANDIAVSTADIFSKTISGATTLTVSSIPVSPKVAVFNLELTNGGSAVITWFSGVKWAGGAAPTLTAAGLDILQFYTRDGGTTWRGAVISKDNK